MSWDFKNTFDPEVRAKHAAVSATDDDMYRAATDQQYWHGQVFRLLRTIKNILLLWTIASIAVAILWVMIDSSSTGGF